MTRFNRNLIWALACGAMLGFYGAPAEAENTMEIGAVQSAKLPVGVKAEQVRLKVEGGSLSGTLLLPKAVPGKRAPGLVLVGGSDLGASAAGVAVSPRAAFAEIASHMAGRGVAVLRYDGRCRTESMCGEEATPHDMIEDAAAALVFMTRRAEVDPARVVLFGHDEGGMFATSVAANPPSDKEKAAGLILAGMPGRTYVKVIRDQAQKRLEANKTPKEKMEEYLAALDSSLQVASSGSVDTGKVPEIANDNLFVHIRKLRAYFFHLSINDPLQIIRAINVPVLIVQGEKDAHVGVRDAQYLKESIDRQYHTDSTLSVLPQMDHWMRAQSGAPDITAGDDSARPIDPALLALLDEWIDKRFKETKETKKTR
ncbi:MAG: alpha/beta hydrolase [Acidobacteria bacterium]|nr:alpha/beta hydrolase [Acidobacteriota bacterium]